MYRKIFITVINILLILFFLKSAHTVSAAGLTASPAEVVKGSPVTIKAIGLTNNDLYQVNIIDGGKDCVNSQNSDAILKQSFQLDSNGSCPDIQADGLSNVSCTNLVFTGTVDTNTNNFDLPKGSNSRVFKACLMGPDLYPGDAAFTVKSSSSSTSQFSIDKLFDSNGNDITQDNPAVPGTQIGIQLKDSPDGIYNASIGNKVFDPETAFKNSQFTFYITLPGDLAKDQSQVSVVVHGPNSTTSEKVLYLKSGLSNNTTDVLATTPTPLPSPTPRPPQPPCSNAEWVTRGTDPTYFGKCYGVFTGFGFSIRTEPNLFIRDLFGILLSLSGGVAVLIIIRAGYQMMTSAGNAEAVKEARERITSAIIGLLFLIFSLIILEVIGVDILHIPGISH